MQIFGVQLTIAHFLTTIVAMHFKTGVQTILFRAQINHKSNNNNAKLETAK